MVEVKKKQIRQRLLSGRDYYLVVYVEHTNTGCDDCIILSEDGTLRKVPVAVVSTWELVLDTDETTELIQSDEFLKEVFKNL
jgi:hypothetical protein